MSFYTPLMIDFLKNNSSKKPKELTDLFNKEFNTKKTFNQIFSFLLYKNIYVIKYPRFTPLMINFLKNNSLKYNLKKLTDLFNKEFNTNYQLQRIRMAMGSRNIKYITNYNPPIGSEIITKNTGDTLIKISNKGHSFCNRKGTWVLKRRFLWEKTYGNIPKGYVVIFLDNNNFNFELDNLALATKNEILLLNKYGLYFNDKEMTRTGLLIIRQRLITIKAMFKGLSEKEKKATQNKYYKNKKG
jgi:hypothetical protein